jgi:hypothetical protein
VKIAAGECPLATLTLIVGLESKKTLFEIGQTREIVGREDFSLED